MKERHAAILLALTSTIFTATGQILFKKTSAIISSNLLSFINPFFFFSMAAYGIGAVLLIFALKKGELSLTFPLLALSYVWVNFAAVYLFNEVLMPLRIIGTLFVIAGVVLLGL